MIDTILGYGTLFLMLLVPVWFIYSLVKWLQITQILRNETGEAETMVLKKNRMYFGISCIISATILFFIIYGFILLSRVGC